ncbi:MAG: hypothetical protein M1294_09915 [Firmicutes bacterium]|nr:hypothetical protein [Bacillota bacterium]
MEVTGTTTPSNWQVLALIIGATFPGDLPWDGIAIRVLSEQEKEDLVAQSMVMIEPPELDQANSAYYGKPRVRVHSNWLAEFTIDANNRFEAIILARKKLQTSLASVSLVLNADTYEVMLIQCNPNGLPISEGILSAPGKIRHWENPLASLPSQKKHQLNQFSTLAQNHEPLKNAITYWIRGWDIFANSTDPLTNQFSFLLFFMTIEYSVNHVIQWYRREAKALIAETEAATIRRLEIDFEKHHGKTGKLASLVMKAGEKINIHR